MTPAAKGNRNASPRKRVARTKSQSARQSLSSRAMEERIAKRAYELYLERGGHPGRELDDWLQAEHDVRMRRSS